MTPRSAAGIESQLSAVAELRLSMCPATTIGREPKDAGAELLRRPLQVGQVERRFHTLATYVHLLSDDLPDADLLDNAAGDVRTQARANAEEGAVQLEVPL